MTINRKTVEGYVLEWTKEKISDEFEFREHQFEAIIDIIVNILEDGNKNYVVEAPTGAGKSLINIIAAGVLSEYFDLTSYILVSDLFLWEQYDKFIQEHKDMNFASIKGQTGNYTCRLNKEDMRNADCKMAGLSWASLFNRQTIEKYGYDCAYKCEYVKARKKALSAKVCLMTYQLFLFTMNNASWNQDSKGNPIFARHDIIFCDECHNIPNLVQGQYSPTIKENIIEKFVELYNYNIRLHGGFFDDGNIIDIQKEYYHTEAELRKYWHNLWSDIHNEAATKADNLRLFNRYCNFVKLFGSTVEEIENSLAIKQRSSSRISKDDMHLYKITSWYCNYVCFISDFCTAINDCGDEYVIKQVNINNDTQEVTVTFNCAKEDYMCYKYLLSTAEHHVMMSATVGMREAFEDNIGLYYQGQGSSLMDVIPSSFDFTNSPVLIHNKYKMSYNEKDMSFPHIINMIYQIMRAFSDKRGMIQTGSYENAKYIYDNAPSDIKRRLQLYNNSQEKNWTIEMHKALDNSVLIGPTLIEGVDLPGDLLRFIIIAKIPYPNLQDKLVKAKMKLFPKWYDSETANSIIQGIGRGNRFHDDWCVTYIIDGCFDNLYRKTCTQFSTELQKRIKHI